MRAIGPTFTLLAVVSLGLAAASAPAATPVEIQKGFEADARQGTPAFAGFSAQRGEQFFKARHGNDWTCASCHSENPLGPGRHARTGKNITALAPGTNPQRFTDPASVEKWFRRNCNDVLGRVCTAQEKGDVLQYLLSVR